MSRINEISSQSKKAILDKIKNTHLSFEKIPTIDPIEHIKTSDDMYSELKEKMSANKYIVEESSLEKLEEKINQIVKSYGYKSLIYPDNLNLDINKIEAEKKTCFNQEIEKIRKEVFHSDFSIIQARVGVSSHGVALVLSDKTQPRMLSLAPMLCIVLLKKENIVKSISQALNLVKEENEILPSNILFIAGPSRTADIELITVFGVHGSQKVHIILY
ncbi:lactate utilization protein C [Campylobacter sp. IFREMER_LSEM_CL292]|uniref:LutC/YkgG family protein n=1 Tax=unclassified Campylobacter TaxID=2593542 RepID=UPI0017A09200|nr:MULTISPECIES: lactate utilization protein C [unclassified Campylobacter]EAJ0348102.1 lactate utilization protein C [Campylobacter lari]MCV3382884.1 lactate utilization protein C [Campylobacter sp. IFREMER_LSEM_CL292]MCV3403355.1 lactate utilization protein C [Campylobacter sp. IFREMER_LSEM_CL2090]MCV3479807.1 lactate utilization protein C [Campylobacter sp. CNRCH_2015_1657]MCV3553277.1 lactate utilization protein C [Campylobacter sp. CNRCH_2013_0898h]